MRSPDDMASIFRSHGRKVTPQRMAVCAALYENPDHPSAEAVRDAVVDRLSNVSLRTVYSVLRELEEMGEILDLRMGAAASRFDPNVTPHHHVICDSCGKVRDVAVDHHNVRPVGPTADGFRITDTEIVFRGVCEACIGVGNITHTTHQEKQNG